MINVSTIIDKIQIIEKPIYSDQLPCGITTATSKFPCIDTRGQDSLYIIKLKIKAEGYNTIFSQVWKKWGGSVKRLSCPIVPVITSSMSFTSKINTNIYNVILKYNIANNYYFFKPKITLYNLISMIDNITNVEENFVTTCLPQLY